MYRLLPVLIITLIISCSPARKYLDDPGVKKWETEIVKFERSDSAETYPEDAILFVGSSSIKLWKTLAEDMDPFPVIHRGFGGSQLTDVVAYADRIISPHPCQAIVIFVANDITGNQTDKSPEDVAELFKDLLKIIRKSHSDTPVFWIEVTPTSSRWKAWPQIQESTRLIREICNSRKNTYSIRTDFAFLNEKGMPKDELFVADKLHLNTKGYEVWNGIIKNELIRVLKK